MVGFLSSFPCGAGAGVGAGVGGVYFFVGFGVGLFAPVGAEDTEGI